MGENPRIQMKINRLFDASSFIDYQISEDNDPPIYEHIEEYLIPNAYINAYGYITKGFSNIEAINSPRLRNSVAFKAILSNYLLKEKIKVHMPAISYLHGWYDSYYHYVAECLPKLYCLRHHLNKSIVVTRADFKPWHTLWLDILDIPNQLALIDTQILETPQAISCGFMERDLNFHPQITSEFRKWVIEKLKTKNLLKPAENYPKKLFINRSKAKYRQILNFEDIRPILVENDYQIIDLEDYEVIEQLNFFYHADYIIGIHGAGFTNMLVTSAKVVDIIDENFHQFCYYKLAKVLGLEYDFLGCKPSPNPNFPHDGKSNLDLRHNNLVVDIEEFKKMNVS
jgi:capsular polysaccharide biosynthesis protein